MRYLKSAAMVLVTSLLIILLNVKIDPLPPLGPFFSPFHGFWQNARHEQAGSKAICLKGLTGPVKVVWDERMVPHIFAESAHDLYFAQGYIMAGDRLWQMEFQSRIAGGRLSEILGEDFLEHDRLQRRLGMVYAAENAVREIEAYPESCAVMAAYTLGVNTYINELSPRDYPVEYKILGYGPEQWTPLKSALVQKFMAWRLTGYSEDFVYSRLAEKLGTKVVEEFFPTPHREVPPVIPLETQWDFEPQGVVPPKSDFKPRHLPSTADIPEQNPAGGSNNWAAGPSKTASGKPILASDPHLGFVLPSVWYEIQLCAPGVNVYGVSLPGLPCVTIGFNQNIAWGVTNAATDVSDWYEIQFKDSSRKEYLYDGGYRKTREVLEVIKIRGKVGFEVETVKYTHHGPIVCREGENLFQGKFPREAAFRWAAHDPSNELRAFLEINRAKNYREFTEALSHYHCPAQNFAFACSDGTIAMWHNGKFPRRWPGQGFYIGDGSDPAYEWQWIPFMHNPHVENPPQGFVCSANQVPTSASYPYFMPGIYSTYRAGRICEELKRMDQITMDDMRRLQNDNHNLHAAAVLPAMFAMVERERLSAEEIAILESIQAWDFWNGADVIAPTVFDKWWEILHRSIWEDEFDLDAKTRLYPRTERTVRMILEERGAPWFDDVRTPAKETLPYLTHRAFTTACERLREKLGPVGAPWNWGNYKGTSIPHWLGPLKSFGRHNISIGGGSDIVNATTAKWGPSWKMVVELGDPVVAWGIYPGGQSGNPGSPYYDNFIDTWSRGELFDLLYLKSAQEGDKRIVGTWILEVSK